MTGRHRGGRTLRWRLVVAVLAAAVGRGYAGQHRLERAALGLAPVLDAGPIPAATDDVAALTPAAPAVSASAADSLPTPVTWSPARLTVVQVPSSPDPLVDTLPHPVVKMFPIPVAQPMAADLGAGAVKAAVSVGSAESAVYADVDGEREARLTADLVDGVSRPGINTWGASGAAARRNNGAYHGRHSA